MRHSNTITSISAVVVVIVITACMTIGNKTSEKLRIDFVYSYNGKVIGWCPPGRLYEIDVAPITIREKYKTYGFNDVSLVTCCNNGYLVVGKDANGYAANICNDEGSYIIYSSKSFISSAVIASDVVYMTTYGGEIIKYDGMMSRAVYKCESQLTSSIAYDNSTIIVSARDGSVLLYDTHHDKVMAAYETKQIIDFMILEDYYVSCIGSSLAVSGVDNVSSASSIQTYRMMRGGRAALASWGRKCFGYALTNILKIGSIPIFIWHKANDTDGLRCSISILGTVFHIGNRIPCSACILQKNTEVYLVYTDSDNRLHVYEIDKVKIAYGIMTRVMLYMTYVHCIIT